uniref:Ribonuclease n=1 Tax=Eutreptiella gymnastica TaxID=73025 RepID=A0A7S4FFY5_9EUGL
MIANDCDFALCTKPCDRVHSAPSLLCSAQAGVRTFVVTVMAVSAIMLAGATRISSIPGALRKCGSAYLTSGWAQRAGASLTGRTMRSDALPLSQRSIFVLRPSSTAPQLPSANRGPMGRQTLVQTCEASSASPVPCIVHGRSTWPALPKASRAFHHADFWAAGFGLSIGLMMLSAVCCLRSYFSSLKEVVAGVLHKKSYVAMGAIAPAQVQWTQFASATLGRTAQGPRNAPLFPVPRLVRQGHTGPLLAARRQSIGPDPKPKGRRKVSASLSRDFEWSLTPAGCVQLAGVDEAGRGPLAGPVVAAACVIPKDAQVMGIVDSKKITTERRREEVYEALTTHPQVVWNAAIVDVQTIEDTNILSAALLAMDDALEGLPCDPEFVLVDGNQIPPRLKERGSYRSVVKGDSSCFSVAAASVIAKVTRDRLMHEYDAQYPEYNFAQHKGYPTAEHMDAIKKHGPCPIHRMTFKPLKEWFPSPRPRD